MVIILDSGHNEKTAGKQSPDGSIKEWEYTYRLAEAVRKELLMKRGIQPWHLDADPAQNAGSDKNELNFRVKVANNLHSAFKTISEKVILVSIHLDAYSSATPCGATVFVAPNASSASRELGNVFARNIKKYHLQGNRAEQLKTGNFAIIRDTSCPAILIECAFMTNPHDEEFLKSKDGFETIKTWILESLKEYINLEFIKNS